ncbi:MAG TPA: PhzF family phenazine biosynthesis protein [Myxococcales bacterium]|nr:PhzF family phenazine biosynthesis protein [Myxococcales bacterium]
MRRPCYVVDAFSAQPLAGNPAGVLLDGAELDASAMQRIASELKHSETAFPLPAREPGAALHLRWFTPEAEVAFCGHATLATFHVLVEEARRIHVPESGVTRTAFTCKSGLLNVELSRVGGKLRTLIETPASRFAPLQMPAGVLAALGLVPEALDPRIPPQKSAILEGNLYLALRDRDALARCRPEAAALEQHGKQLGVAGFVVYTLAPKDGIDAAVRCFFPGYGILEDPVTGSAAGQLGALIQTMLPEPMPRRLVFTQGDEMGRPGRVEVEVRPDQGPGRVRGFIGGNAVTILRGELEL